MSEDSLITDVDKVNKIFPEETEIVSENDSTSTETFQSERPQNCVEMSKDNCEVKVQESDTNFLNCNVTRCSLTVNESLDSSVIPVTGKEMPGITTEVQQDEFSPDAVEGCKEVQENYTIEETDLSGVPNDLSVSNGLTNLISELNNEECEVQVKDDEFHDAVQFFKDPLSLTFLENAGSTNASEEPTRSSLYVNFDPLHAKSCSQSIKPKELHGTAEDDKYPKKPSEDHAFSEIPSVEDCTNPEISNGKVWSVLLPDILNKQCINADRHESLEDALISFDSPVTSKSPTSTTLAMLDRANTEVANVKKAVDAQVAELTAQLKKAELKISTLESDVEQLKIENGKLSSICHELMDKFI